VRLFWYLLLEWGRRGFDEGTLARRGMLQAAERHLRRAIADETLRARLRPNYPLGCKRLIYANDFYPALARPNVALVTEAISHITANGVCTADGVEHAADVLVCATGFDAQHSLLVPIQGRGGRTLAEAWADGPQAHLGLTVAGFPNLVLMLGPNTATGHTSTLLFIEPGVAWALRAMAEVERRGQHWLDVKPAAMSAFNTLLQQRLHHSVWNQCRSWYRDANGRNTALFPGFTGEYKRLLRTQSFADFEFG
ncbi:MAG: 4-hydroxyacetophenone monooxygenase, partial [Rubrivivax sp.]